VNEDKDRSYAFWKYSFEEKRNSLHAFLGVQFRIGKNPPRFEKEIRDKGEEEAKMQMRLVTEEESRKLDGVWSPAQLAVTLKSLE